MRRVLPWAQFVIFMVRTLLASFAELLVHSQSLLDVVMFRSVRRWQPAMNSPHVHKRRPKAAQAFTAVANSVNPRNWRSMQNWSFTAAIPLGQVRNA